MNSQLAKPDERGASGVAGARIRLLGKIRGFNKKYANPLILRIAGQPLMPLGIVYHVGRKSGREFSTPVLAARTRGGFMISLAYGEEIDWVRNVMAAGQCKIMKSGKKYNAGRPQVVGAAEALPAFPLLIRLFLRILAVQRFLKLRRLPDES
jgi:deazaflavin-dependent oxidoreductase (nitroreductase family)